MPSAISFLQVASSAVRPLTKIPHCCTKFALGFFHPQCGRSTISASTKRIMGLLSHYLNNYLSLRLSILLKAVFPFLYKGFISLTLRWVNNLILTCSPLLIKKNLIKRSISMCQAFGQRSFRVITKLIYY